MSIAAGVQPSAQSDGQRFSMADLANDRYGWDHPKEGHEPTEVDLLTIRPRRLRLHAGDVG